MHDSLRLPESPTEEAGREGVGNGPYLEGDGYVDINVVIGIPVAYDRDDACTPMNLEQRKAELADAILDEVLGDPRIAVHIVTGRNVIE